MLTISVGITTYLFYKSGLLWEGAGVVAFLAVVCDAMLAVLLIYSLTNKG